MGIYLAFKVHEDLRHPIHRHVGFTPCVSETQGFSTVFRVHEDLRFVIDMQWGFTPCESFQEHWDLRLETQIQWGFTTCVLGPRKVGGGGECLSAPPQTTSTCTSS